MRVALPWNPNLPIQVLTGPEEMPLLAVVREMSVFVYLDDCPDEGLPLERDDETVPAVNSRGEIICAHHAARFDSCTGCTLSPGNAHHVQRLEAGLRSIAVIASDEGSLEVEIEPELLTLWRRLRDLRFRKSFGRGLVGHCRYLLARLGQTGRRPEASRQS